MAHALGEIEDQGNRQTVILLPQMHDRAAGFRLYLGRINHRQLATCQPLGCDEVQDIEGIISSFLVVLIIADVATTDIGREHFRSLELLACKGVLARPTRAD